MDVWTLLFDVVALLGVGAVLGALFERLRQSAILGYVLAGALLGPNVLHLVQGQDEVLAVSEFGVALLLFAIGLEFSFERLRSTGTRALRAGGLQVVLTSAAGAAVALLCGFTPAGAFAVGGMVAFSSTACVLRTLTAAGELGSGRGDRSLGILLVQDVAVVPFVLVVGVLAEGGTAAEIAVRVGRTGAISIGLVAALFLAYRYAVPRLLSLGATQSNRELALLVAVASGLGAAVAAHAAGVSPALGAFVAGVLLAESPFAVQVRAEVSSLKTLLLALFFSAVGMLVDPGWIAANALPVAGAVVAVLVGKMLLTAAALRILRATPRASLEAGIGLAQVGEFSFVLATVARGGLIGEEAFLLVVSVAVLTMALTPTLVTHAPRLAARLATRRPHGGAVPEPDDSPLVLVVGFGPAGRAAVERVGALGGRVVVLDQNPRAAADARALGHAAVTGDARFAEVLEHAALPRAAGVMVTIPDSVAAAQIVRLAGELAPTARVMVRARFHRAYEALGSAGADVVVDEEYEVGRRIARSWEEWVGATDRPAAEGEEPAEVAGAPAE